MIWSAKMGAKRFRWVFFVDVTEVLHQPLLESPFSLANIDFIAKCAFQAIDNICAVTAKIRAALERLACGSGGNCVPNQPLHDISMECKNQEAGKIFPLSPAGGAEKSDLTMRS